MEAVKCNQIENEDDLAEMVDVTSDVDVAAPYRSTRAANRSAAHLDENVEEEEMNKKMAAKKRRRRTIPISIASSTVNSTSISVVKTTRSAAAAAAAAAVAVATTTTTATAAATKDERKVVIISDVPKKRTKRGLISDMVSTNPASSSTTTTTTTTIINPILKPKPKRVDVRRFQPKWTDLFGFVENEGRAMCVFCQDTVSRKSYSVQRHFQALHSKYFSNDTEKAEAIERALSHLDTQRNVIEMAKKEKEYSTEASFAMTLAIIDKGKPFIEGEFIKSTLIACAETLFQDFENKEQILKRINDIPASKSTIQRRISELASDILNQQTTYLLSCQVFSVSLEETLDNCQVRRLTVFARYVATDDQQIHEGLCYQRQLDKTATGQTIFNGFVQHFEQRGVDIDKIVSVTTDGSHCLAGKPDGFISLLQERIGHVVISSPCILHVDDMCSTIYNGELKQVMDTVIKTVNHLASKPSNVHACFQELFNEAEQDVGELSPRNNVRWFGSKVIHCFMASLDDVRSFFGEKWQTFPELWNDFWLMKLAFLADLIDHLDDLNERLQRKGQTIELLYEQWKLFTSKLTVFKRDIQMTNFRYFPNLRKFTTNKLHGINHGTSTLIGAAAVSLTPVAAGVGTTSSTATPSLIAVDVQILDALEQSFYERFQDFHNFSRMLPFIVRPDEFVLDDDFDAEFIAWLLGSTNNLEMELLELKVCELWSSKFRQLRRQLEKLHVQNDDDDDVRNERESEILICWNSLPDNKFGSMKKVAQCILTIFGSTLCSKQTQIYLKQTINRLRNRLTIENSETSARLKLTNYKPNVKKLCAEISAQGSH